MRSIGRALDAIVKGCSDVLLINGTNVLLAQRTVDPQPGWWFIGGRMQPGETPQEAASRHVYHDVGVLLDSSEFHFLSVASYAWARRKQPPQENGTADVALIFYAQLSDAVAASLLIRNTEEYNCFRWCALQDAVAYADMHPALKDSLRCLAQVITGLSVEQSC